MNRKPDQREQRCTAETVPTSAATTLFSRRPFYSDGTCTIYHGDCRELLAVVEADLVLSDPPWGSKTQCNAQRFSRAKSPWWKTVDTSLVTPHNDIQGDDVEFDPRPFIEKPAILWGANWFTRHLPHSGGWLVWDKRKGAEQLAEKGWPLGEAELAWTNIRGSVRVFRNLWSGLLRSTEKGEFYHPTQKPVALMRWCLGMAEDAKVVFDPFMGSGTTLVAAKLEGRKAVGIEIEEPYCEIAANRLRQGTLF